MAKQVVWSLRAQGDRKNILDYWIQRNKSKPYSKKLNALINVSTQLISAFPKLGRETDIKNVRVKVIKDYLLIYEETKERIEVLTIWDNRQSSEKLIKRLR